MGRSIGLSMLGVAMAVALLWPAPGAAQRSNSGRPAAGLQNPAALKEKAPGIYKARFDTTRAPFVIEVHRDWAPIGADRFYNLVKNGFYDGCAFFRVVPYFMVEFGINGNPAVQAAWRTATIDDDPVKVSNKRGYVTFSAFGKNTRTTQVFINYRNNATLDAQGFAPFGEIVEGMDAVSTINPEYREQASQQRIQLEGNAYLRKEFPRMNFVRTATIEK